VEHRLDSCSIYELLKRDMSLNPSSKKRVIAYQGYILCILIIPPAPLFRFNFFPRQISLRPKY